MSRMDLGHAATLALVGWYLMVPSLPRGKTTIDISAPIGTWLILSSHDSAVACEEAKTEAQQKFSESSVRTPVPSAHPETYYGPVIGNHAALFATCIATDDPRLK
jgi:hypothetical protein